MQVLKNWYNGTKDYKKGVVLYNVYGSDQQLKNYFTATIESVTSRYRLNEAILNLIEGSAQLQADNKTEYNKVRFDTNTSKDDSDEVLIAIKKQWLPLYSEMNYLRGQLLAYDTDIERGKAAFQILTLEQKCIALWAQADYYREHGTLKEVEKQEDVVPIINPIKAGERIENLKRYIRRLDRDLKTKPKNKNAPKWAEKLLTYKKELNNYTNEQN